MSGIVVSALYKFVTLENYQEIRKPLHQTMEENDVKGTLLLAVEGINGTIAGSRQGIAPAARYRHQNCQKSCPARTPHAVQASARGGACRALNAALPPAES